MALPELVTVLQQKLFTLSANTATNAQSGKEQFGITHLMLHSVTTRTRKPSSPAFHSSNTQLARASLPVESLTPLASLI